ERDEAPARGAAGARDEQARPAQDLEEAAHPDQHQRGGQPRRDDADEGRGRDEVHHADRHHRGGEETTEGAAEAGQAAHWLFAVRATMVMSLSSSFVHGGIIPGLAINPSGRGPIAGFASAGKPARWLTTRTRTGSGVAAVASTSTPAGGGAKNWNASAPPFSGVSSPATVPRVTPSTRTASRSAPGGGTTRKRTLRPTLPGASSSHTISGFASVTGP